MKKLKLTKANPGSYQRDLEVFERLKSFNNGQVDLTHDKIIIKAIDKSKFSSHLRKTEEDFMSETFQGSYENGENFRLIMEKTVKVITQGRNKMTTLASLN